MCDGVYWFSYKVHINKGKEVWGVALPNISQNWVNLCTEGVCIPGHVTHFFLQPSSSPTSSTFDLIATFVSAINLNWDCPPSLIEALAKSHLDRKVWLKSCYEEKCGIENLQTFQKIMLGEYRAHGEKGVPKAIPTMCVLTIKKTRFFSHFVLNLVSLLLATMKTGSGLNPIVMYPSSAATAFNSLSAFPLKKNLHSVRATAKMPFVKAFFPMTKSQSYVLLWVTPMLIWLLHSTLYGLWHSPHHRYDKINKNLQAISLWPLLEDPSCFYTGFIKDSNDTTSKISSSPLSLGLYVDNFVYFSEEPEIEALFCCLLGDRCKVDVIGIIEWVSGAHFSWHIPPTLVLVHLNQFGFTSNLDKSFFCKSCNPTLTAIPYQNSVPIIYITQSINDGISPDKICQKRLTRVLSGACAGWQ